MEKTYKCSQCQDRGVLLAEREYEGGPYMAARGCLNCERGQRIAETMKADAEKSERVNYQDRFKHRKFDARG